MSTIASRVIAALDMAGDDDEARDRIWSKSMNAATRREDEAILFADGSAICDAYADPYAMGARETADTFRTGSYFGADDGAIRRAVDAFGADVIAKDAQVILDPWGCEFIVSGIDCVCSFGKAMTCREWALENAGTLWDICETIVGDMERAGRQFDGSAERDAAIIATRDLLNSSCWAEWHDIDQAEYWVGDVASRMVAWLMETWEQEERHFGMYANEVL